MNFPAAIVIKGRIVTCKLTYTAQGSYPTELKTVSRKLSLLATAEMSSYLSALLVLTQSVLFYAVCSLLTVNAQQDFTTAQVPTFNVGVFYPGRSNIALQAEVQTCRGITDRIARNSARFNSELVTNTDGAITFATADSRLMSSRMQSRLGELARSYSGRMTVLKAWSPFPDPELAQENNSLHYEGQAVYLHIAS